MENQAILVVGYSLTAPVPPTTRGVRGGLAEPVRPEYLSSKMNIHPDADTETEVERDAAQAAALKLFVVLARAHTAVDDQMALSMSQLGLTNTEFAILEVLHHKGPLLLGDIQRKILVTDRKSVV